LKAVFYDMRKVDKNFSAEKFLSGAKKAFEMIVEAFNKGDVETLKNLVDAKILKKFTAAIEGYKARGEKIEQTLVGFKEAKILSASLEGTEAKITVEFETEQAKVVTDAKGKVIEGDAVMISTVIDIWEFQRNLKAKSPNWLLISAKGGN
jgi:predicted lipid-binding transport protein (Tim44 family)